MPWYLWHHTKQILCGTGNNPQIGDNVIKTRMATLLTPKDMFMFMFSSSTRKSQYTTGHIMTM